MLYRLAAVQRCVPCRSATFGTYVYPCTHVCTACNVRNVRNLRDVCIHVYVYGIRTCMRSLIVPSRPHAGERAPSIYNYHKTSFHFSQFHYDWGLRAVKSVLLVAGKLKRCDPDIDEEAVLMRALRDFNTPKVGWSWVRRAHVFQGMAMS